MKNTIIIYYIFQTF